MDYILSKSTAFEHCNVLIVCVPVLAILSVLFLWQKKASTVRIMQKFPGPKTNLLFGNTLQFKRNPSDFRDQVLGWSDEYVDKGVFCTWLGPFHPVLYLYKPEYAERLLSSSQQIRKSYEYSFLHPWLNTGLEYKTMIDTTGLLTSTGDKWKSRRRLITPTFHFKILNEFIQVFEEQSEVLVSILKTRCNNGPMDIFPIIVKCALDIICKSSMGSSVNAQRDGNTTYVNAVTRISELIQDRQKSPWVWRDWIYNLTPSGRLFNQCLQILHGFTNRVIDERMNERKCTGRIEEEPQVDEFTGKPKRRPLAFLDLLLDAYDEGKIDRQGIREEVDTFMFEGHDTTAAAMSWAVLLLGLHPDVQRKAQEEVDAFFDSRTQTLTVESLKDLKYLECVIKEALRLYSSVPGYARQLSKDLEIGGIMVPKGITVVVGPMTLHTNPRVWPHPDKFDPDRFLPENSEGRHPYAYIPFSAGPRNCIGQRFALLEVKVVLSYLLRHFDVKSEQSRDEIKVCAEIVQRPQVGIMVTLSPRI